MVVSDAQTTCDRTIARETSPKPSSLSGRTVRGKKKKKKKNGLPSGPTPGGGRVPATGGAGHGGVAGTRHGMPRKRKRREGREAEAEGPGDGGGGPGGSLGQRLVRARSGGEVLRLARGLRAPEHGPLLGHALHCLAKLRPGRGEGGGVGSADWEHLLRELAKSGDALSGRDVSKALWALSKLSKLGSPCPELLGVLQRRAIAIAGQFDARGVSNALWSFAALGHRPPPRLLHALERAFEARLRGPGGGVNAQDLSNALWGFAKLGWRPEEGTLRAFGAAARRCGRAFKPEELSMAFYAVGALGIADDDGGRELFAALEARLGGHRFSAQSIANVLWAYAKLGRAPPGPVLAALLAQAVEGAGHFTAQGLANTIWSCAKLGLGLERGAGADLVAREVLRPRIKDMGGMDAGDVLWALAKLEVTDAELFADVCARGLRCMAEMRWQDLGHVEYAWHKRALRSPRTAEFHDKAAKRMGVLLDGATRGAELDARVDDLFHARGRCLEAMEPGASVLLAGPVAPGLEEALKEAGHSTARWLRFRSSRYGETRARAWPKGSFTAAVVRAPQDQGAAELMVHAVASRMPKGSRAFVYGDGCGGWRRLKAVVGGLYMVEEERSFLEGEVRAFCVAGVRNGAPARASLKRWAAVSSMQLGAGRAAPWTTFPGLFSGGLLDPMSELLIAAVPSRVLKKRRRVLDFCSGSGVIAAHLMAREATLELHLLDADAVALRAAASNVPGAALHLSDGWRGFGGGALDVIVSNPPVHVQQHSDFTVLRDLLREGCTRLRRGGRMYVVVQAYVPLRALLGASAPGRYAKCKLAASDGRFSVWKLKAPNAKAKGERGGGIPT